MSDDFCLLHGQEKMRSDRGPIPYCSVCDKVEAAYHIEKVIEFGRGRNVVDWGTYWGFQAVFIEPIDRAGPVGESAKAEGLPRYKLRPGSTVLVFKSGGSAEVVIDAIQRAAVPIIHDLPGLVREGREWRLGPNASDDARRRERLIGGRLADAAERLTHLVQAVLDNDPNELVADGGITALDVWRKEAKQILGQQTDVPRDDASKTTGTQDLRETSLNRNLRQSTPKGMSSE